MTHLLLQVTGNFTPFARPGTASATFDAPSIASMSENSVCENNRSDWVGVDGKVYHKHNISVSPQVTGLYNLIFTRCQRQSFVLRRII